MFESEGGKWKTEQRGVSSDILNYKLIYSSFYYFLAFNMNKRVNIEICWAANHCFAAMFSASIHCIIFIFGYWSYGSLIFTCFPILPYVVRLYIFFVNIGKLFFSNSKLFLIYPMKASCFFSSFFSSAHYMSMGLGNLSKTCCNGPEPFSLVKKRLVIYYF